MIRNARTDANQKEIVKAFRGMGAYVVHTHQIKGFCDCLVYFRGQTFSVEIKDSTKPLSKRKLTPMEQECKEQVEARGCTYHVIESVEDAIKLLIQI